MHSFDFLFDLPQYQQARFPKLVAGGHWDKGKITMMSINEMASLMRRVAIQLLTIGTKKGDLVILVTDRFSLEWLITDMAIMSTGAISVPLHYPQREADLELILQRIEPALIIKSENIELLPLADQFRSIPFESLFSGDQNESKTENTKLDAIRNTIRENDIATIVHTSGSSGEPRAVCLSHANVVTNVKAILSLVPFKSGTRVMSFLPLSHIFERIVCYVYLASGASIYFLDSYRYAVFAIQDIRPDYFTSVPLILERFAAALEERVEERGWFTRWAYSSWEGSRKKWLSHFGSIIAHQWIIKQWKRRLGGNLKGIISGAAYLDPKVERLYERSGIKLRQGYGLTEASPVVSINRFEPGGHRRGTVGQPLPGVEVRIAEDGEILVKGPNVMAGYYKDESATKEVIRNGWLHTGDVGYWEKDKFLVITDRKRNIYKHASGKFISPVHIESTLTQHPLIQYAVIIGHRKPYTIALILPDFGQLKKVCDEKDIHWTAPEYMVHNTLVIQLYRDLLDHLNLHSHERIEKFILLADSWTIDNGLLTATYKPRRNEMEKKYSKEIEELYED